MELVPIIYKILIISGCGFLLVLIVSFVASKISKNGDSNGAEKKVIYKQVVAARYYNSSGSRYANNGNGRIIVKNESKPGKRPKEIRVIRKANSKDHFDRFTHYNTKTRGNKPRYSIVNKTLLNDEATKHQTNAQYKIIYPIDYSRSA